MGGLSGEEKSMPGLMRIQAAIARGEAREVADADIEAELARTQAIWKAGGCGTCGCARCETCDACPDCQPDEEKRLDAAEREFDPPSPPNTEAALALVLGVACMALGANLDRIGGAYRLSEGRIDIGLTLDGRPLHPSEAAEVEQALRAVRGGRR